MASTIRLTVALDPPAAAAVAAFRDEPDTWLPTPLRRNGLQHWQVYLWAGQIGVLVDCAVKDVVCKGSRWQRRLRWRPLRGELDSALSRAVPSFDGTLSVVERDGRGPQLVLAGAYRPPGGVAGSLLDRLALHRLARRTAKTFLRSVAERLAEVARRSIDAESNGASSRGGGGVAT